MRHLVAVTAGHRELREGRLERCTDSASRPQGPLPRVAHRQAGVERPLADGAHAGTATRAARADTKRSISASVVTSVAHTSKRVGQLGVVRIPARQGQPCQHPLIQQRRVDRQRVGHPDGELVEIRAVVHPSDAHLGQRGLHPPRGRCAPGRDIPQAVRPKGRDVDGGGQGAQRLVGADVAGRPVAPDVLLASPERHHVRPAPIDVEGPADEPPGHLARQRLGGRQHAQVGAAVLGRDAQRLPFADRDIGADLAR